MSHLVGGWVEDEGVVVATSVCHNARIDVFADGLRFREVERRAWGDSKHFARRYQMIFRGTTHLKQFGRGWHMEYVLKDRWCVVHIGIQVKVSMVGHCNNRRLITSRCGVIDLPLV